MASRVPVRRPGVMAALAASLLLAVLAPAPVAAAAPTIAQLAYAKPPNPIADGFFGTSTGVSGNTLVVGAPGDSSGATGVGGNPADTSAPGAGGVSVFARTGTAWSPQAYLKPSNTGAGDNFGFAVAIAGDTIVVGAPLEDSAATGVDGDQSDNTAADAGAAYVFVRNGTTWTQQAYLKASNSDAGANFGFAVAIVGDTIVIGAPTEAGASSGVNGDQRGSGAPGSGAVYVFNRVGTTWVQSAYLKASNNRADIFFGGAVAISGTTIAVGAPSEQSASGGVNGDQGDASLVNAGAAYAFGWTGFVWRQEAYLKATTPVSNAGFGTTVAAAGNVVAVGSPTSSDAQGDVFTFARSSAGAWSAQAHLVAPHADTSDLFGASVAASGDTILIGAYGESGGSAGVGGDQTSNAKPHSGAAYAFVRSGATWTLQAYLKASNPEVNDNFGSSVAIDRDTMVASATNEDSDATGVNGDQADNSIKAAGAAYAFYRSPLATKTTIASGASVALGGTLKVTGSVSPAGPGTVTVSRYRLVSGKWRLGGTAKVAVKAGKYAYSVKPSARGSWRFYAAYSGGAGGGATYLASRSAYKAVTVK